MSRKEKQQRPVVICQGCSSEWVLEGHIENDLDAVLVKCPLCFRGERKEAT